MRIKLLLVIGVILLSFPNINFAQAPTLGSAADFVLFSSIGAVTQSGTAPSHLTGNIGGNADASTGFGNIDGVIQDKNIVSAKCSTDLLGAYQQLKNTPKTLSIAPLLGNGQILEKGVYEIGSAAELNLGLTLDAKNDANAVFIFKINGAFSTNASSKIYLKNGALACNVFWMVEGKVGMAAKTTMRGTVIVNNAAIVMTDGDTLEGRALTTNGAVTVSGILGYTPLGCGSPKLTGPVAPVLGSSACFGLFSSTGDLTNTGITYVKGDVGSNTGKTIGFDPLLVKGTIHASSDNVTQQAAADLLKAYNYTNLLPTDIELLYPNLFGSDLVLTPHTYYMNAAAHLTDTVYLNAQGNADAVFVIKINGAFSTEVNSKVKLINGTQSKNVYWAIKGAVTISSNSAFVGTIMNDGAVGSLQKGVKLDGRALTIAGALNTSSMDVSSILAGCTVTDVATGAETNEWLRISPNPFNNKSNIFINKVTESGSVHLSIMDMMGAELINTTITETFTSIKTDLLPSGIYFYQVVNQSGTVQSGKIISE